MSTVCDTVLKTIIDAALTITSYQQIMEFNSTISCSAYYKRRLVASMRRIRRRGGTRGQLGYTINLHQPLSCPADASRSGQTSQTARSRSLPTRPPHYHQVAQTQYYGSSQTVFRCGT